MSQDNRSYFRITNDLILDYHPVDAFTADHQQPDTVFPEDTTLNLFTEFRRLETDAATSLTSISDTNRALADFLGIINRKIDLLAQQVMAERHQNSSIKPTKANISEGGIAFLSDKALYKGSYMALRLFFLPSFIGLTTFARVIRCDEVVGKPYQIAVKFHRIGNAQQQILSRQILQQQIIARRENAKVHKETIGN